MDNPSEKNLVEKALKCGVTGCVIWHPKEAERVRKQLTRYGLNPEGIQRDTIKHVQDGGPVHQVEEKRPEYSHRDYYYKVIIPMDIFPHGLFVEMELHDADEDVPTVMLLNAHD